MGRTCIVDSRLQQYVEDVADAKGWNIGLIIGQLSTQKDYVIHLMSSKSVLENDTESGLPIVESLQALNDLNIVNHARQVKRMLTGGFDVIGIFAVGEMENLKNLQGKLRQIVFSIHKALSKAEVVPSCHFDRLQLLICSRTKNLTCRTFNVKDPKVSAEPCEWKYQKIMDSFLSLSTSFSLESVIPVPSKALSCALQKQMAFGLQPLYQNIWNSLVVINDHLVEDDSLPICPKGAMEQGRGRGRKAVKDEEHCSRLENLDVNLFQEMRIEHESSASTESLDCGAKFLVRGTICSQAYVHIRSSTAEAIQALKRDVIQSIVARCELLCDDLLQTEEEQDVRVLYEMPLRVYCKIPETNIKFCDYVFQGETLDDSADRFHVLLGLDVTSEDIDSSAERLPEEDDLVRPARQLKVRKSCEAEITQTKKPSSVWKYLGVATAAAAAVFSYWLATENNVL